LSTSVSSLFLHSYMDFTIACKFTESRCLDVLFDSDVLFINVDRLSCYGSLHTT
jgi:hypothetical protein